MFIERHTEGNYKTKHAETRLGSTILPYTHTYTHTQRSACGGSAPGRWPAAADAACAMPLPRTQPLPPPRTQPLQRPHQAAGRLAAAGRFGTASSPTPAALLDWYLNRDM